MAEAQWEKIYRISNLISEQRRALDYFRRMDYHHAELILKEHKETLDALCAGHSIEVNGGQNSLSELAEFVYNEERELTLRADILENAVIPVLENYVQSLCRVHGQQVDEDYTVESTSCGFLTVKNIFSGRFLHSNNDPMDEARKQMEALYQPHFSEYAVFGCGLAYQIYQLYKISKGSVTIHVFEQSENKIECARKYGVLDWIPPEVLKIHIEKKADAFLKFISDRGKEIGIFLSFVYVCSLKDDAERYVMLETFGRWHSHFIHREDVLINFYRNIHSQAKLIRDLDVKRNAKEEAVVIAAGPSLDNQLDLLRSWQGKKTLIAVGTVFGKLHKAGIKPDFVVIQDPQQRIIKQIEGLENEETPMILDAAAYWGIAQRYRGPKYMIFTGTEEEIREYQKKKGIESWAAGGTVTALAMEFAIYCGSKTVWLAGVDLAYPGGKSHAVGTMDYRDTNLNGMQEIPGVLGKKVYTSPTFMIYIRWMEDYIANYPEIKWKNLSTEGAKIKGTQEVGGQYQGKECRNKSVIIFAATHVKFDPPANPIYVPLHVGREGKEERGYIGDNVGENISDLNFLYGELTGLYWIWQNIHDVDYVGMCHYRRYFLNKNGRELSREDCLKLLEQYDVIVPKHGDCEIPYLEHYGRAHHAEDLQAVGRALKRLYPECSEAFDRAMQGHIFYSGNLMICSLPVLKDYARWLFTIFAEASEEIDVSGYDNYHRRVYGFLSEQMLFIYMMSYGLSFCEVTVGISQEKAETKALKERLRALLSEGKKDEAQNCLKAALEERPDLLLAGSDVYGELQGLIHEINTVQMQEHMAKKSDFLQEADDMVLVIVPDDTCYGMLKVFARELAKALGSLGLQVVTTDGSVGAKWNPDTLTQTSWKGVIGFQAPALEKDVFRKMDTKKIQFWFDNPCMTQGLLRDLPEDYFVFCQDAGYAEFIRKYLHTPKAYWLPPAGVLPNLA